MENDKKLCLITIPGINDVLEVFKKIPDEKIRAEAVKEINAAIIKDEERVKGFIGRIAEESVKNSFELILSCIRGN